ncbi:MAG: hypothetical protein KAJ52_04065 [Sedimentisphaerales bacterium]|nr:hypothetical protein [Sedimentisphaerales bacterium]
MKKLSSKIAAVLLASCISLNTFASTITVNWDGTGDFLTIQDAIDVASDGDVVAIENGEYIGVRNRDISFYGKEITVRSQNGPDKCIQ